MAIKETKELLKGVFALTKVSAEQLKDGAQVQDLIDGYIKLAADPVKKAEIEAALSGIQLVPDEIKAVTLAEGFELAVFVLQELPALVEAFKAKAV